MPELLTNTAAGTLDQRVQIQRPAPVRDSTGQVIVSWITAHTVWAEILPQTGREPIAARRLVGEITHQVKIRDRRRRDDLWPPRDDWRVVHRGRVLEIDHILSLAEQESLLSLRCVERAAERTDAQTPEPL